MIPEDREITIKIGTPLKLKDHPIRVIFTQGSLTRTFQKRVLSYSEFCRFVDSCFWKMRKEGFPP